MGRRLSLLIGFLAIGEFFSSCALLPSDHDEAYLRYQWEGRLLRISYRLSREALPWCPRDQHWAYGFLLRDGERPDGDQSNIGSSQIVFSYVDPSMPAGEARLRSGDRLLALEGVNMGAQKAAAALIEIDRLTKARIQPLTLTVDQSGTAREVNLTAVPACVLRVQFLESEVPNAYADGWLVQVTSGLLKVVESDAELAWILAHEVAHTVLEHSQNLNLRFLLDRFVISAGGLPGSTEQIPRKMLELQADYLGSYLTARAGYDLAGGRSFLLRVGESALANGVPDFTSSHPGSAERLSSFDLTVNEIARKRANGQPLEPEGGSAGLVPPAVFLP
jgi:hypothetical protein